MQIPLKWIYYLNNFVFNNRPNILYQGWLYKKSDRKRRQWKKRWVVIEDYTKAITYYEDEARSSFRHCIALQDIVDDGIDINHKMHKTYKHGFTLTTLERSYTFASTKQEEMEKWVELIKKARLEVLEEIAEEEKMAKTDERSRTSDYSDLDTKDSDDTDSDSGVGLPAEPSFGKIKPAITDLTDIIAPSYDMPSPVASIDYSDHSVEEKINILNNDMSMDHRGFHQYSQSEFQLPSNDLTFDFDPGTNWNGLRIMICCIRDTYLHGRIER